MQIEKENKNAVKFLSGAIENKIINKSIINILEGTLPAFNNRDAKYMKKWMLQISALPVKQQTTIGGEETSDPQLN